MALTIHFLIRSSFVKRGLLGGAERIFRAKVAEVANPFEDDTMQYVVLRNDEGQHSLWPGWIEVPVGWDAVFGAAERTACLEFIEFTWRDMRPVSLVREMDGD
jgi:uncharacterized protein YbdZ (MbtH family)